MKLFVFLAIVALACADGEWHLKTTSELNNIRSECLAAHPLSAEIIAHIRSFEYPDEESVRKFLLCCALKMEIFTNENGYDPDRVAQQFNFGLDPAEALAIAQNCIENNAAGSPADVQAYRVHKCVLASKLGDLLRTVVKKKIQAAKN